MFRNSYQKTSSSFAQNPYSVTSPSGFMQSNAPLYPVGPTLTRPQFKPVQTRGLSPSPYLDRKAMKPPSYQQRYLKRAQSMAGQVNISFEERERRLIQQNQHEIQQQNKRREQLRISYERQIDALTKKLHRNLQSKQKLLTQIQSLTQVYDQTHQKLMCIEAPEKKGDSFEPIDRKQQEMIILKSKLVSQMRQTQKQLNEKEEEQQKYWQEKIGQKERHLFNLQQGLRQKRMELHAQRQKSLQKPDFLGIQQEIRTQKYDEFMYKYEELQKKIHRLIDERQRSIEHTGHTLQIKKPQLHNINVRKRQLNIEVVDIRLKVQEMSRVAKEMQGANDNLMKQLERKESMIDKYELDIHGLREKKKDNDESITEMVNQGREKQQGIPLLQGIDDEITKTQEEVRYYQSKNSKLKNQYQKLYELLCSATSTNIHQTFNEVLTI